MTDLCEHFPQMSVSCSQVYSSYNMQGLERSIVGRCNQTFPTNQYFDSIFHLILNNLLQTFIGVCCIGTLFLGVADGSRVMKIVTSESEAIPSFATIQCHARMEGDAAISFSVFATTKHEARR